MNPRFPGIRRFQSGEIPSSAHVSVSTSKGLALAGKPNNISSYGINPFYLQLEWIVGPFRNLRNNWKQTASSNIMVSEGQFYN